MTVAWITLQTAWLPTKLYHISVTEGQGYSALSQPETTGIWYGSICWHRHLGRSRRGQLCRRARREWSAHQRQNAVNWRPSGGRPTHTLTTMERLQQRQQLAHCRLQLSMLASFIKHTLLAVQKTINYCR